MRRVAVLASVLPFLAIVALAATPASARAWGWGNATRGDGKKVTQPRQVGEFSKVRLEGSLDATVTVGPARAVSVTIDQNLQPLVQTRLDGDTLVIEAGEISYQGEGRVEISVPALRGFAIRGSGDARIEGGQGDLSLAISGSGDISWRGDAGKLTAAISGSGDMKLAGTAASVDVSVAGSGDVKASDLRAGSADVSVAGSGDVEVRLTGGALRASVAGSGDVVWYGEGRVERASTAGSGEIVHRCGDPGAPRRTDPRGPSTSLEGDTARAYLRPDPSHHEVSPWPDAKWSSSGRLGPPSAPSSARSRRSPRRAWAPSPSGPRWPVPASIRARWAR